MAPTGYRLASIDEDARQFSLALSEGDKRIIAEKIKMIVEDPFRTKSKQLTGPEWERDYGRPVRRFRAGNYRIFYCVERETRKINIVAIKPRTNTTYKVN